MSIVVKGHDVGVEKILPTTYESISESGKQVINIDLNEYKSTKRTIVYNHGNFSKKYISFFFDLGVSHPKYNEGKSNESLVYPQKHIIDIELIGSNGPNGFLLSIPDKVGQSKKDNKDKSSTYNYDSINFPPSISNAVEIKLDGKSSLEDLEYGSDSIKSWKIREYDGWGTEINYDIESSDLLVKNKDFPIYTRKTTMYEMITAILKAVSNGDNEHSETIDFEDYNNRIILLHKYLNFLYSESDTVTLRFTFELNNQYDYFLTIEKFQGGITLS